VLVLAVADNLALQGRHDEARALFERLLAVHNDVGLLAEEYEPRMHRILGNFPKAMSHRAMINTAASLTKSRGPAKDRKESWSAESVGLAHDGHQDRASGRLPQHPTVSTLTAHGTAIQNTSFLILGTLTTLAFLALTGNFLMPVFWAAVLATVFFPL
jgi:hypothetical protein